MMVPRDFNPNDPKLCKALDRLVSDNKHGDIRLDEDIITCVTPGSGSDKIIAISAGRPVLYIHEFVVNQGATQLCTAELLLGYSLAKASMLGERRLHFLVERNNTSMQGFIENHGAWKQHDGLIYTMMVPEVVYGKVQGKR